MKWRFIFMLGPWVTWDLGRRSHLGRLLCRYGYGKLNWIQQLLDARFFFPGFSCLGIISKFVFLFNHLSSYAGIKPLRRSDRKTSYNRSTNLTSISNMKRFHLVHQSMFHYDGIAMKIPWNLLATAPLLRFLFHFKF